MLFKCVWLTVYCADTERNLKWSEQGTENVFSQLNLTATRLSLKVLHAFTAVSLIFKGPEIKLSISLINPVALCVINPVVLWRTFETTLHFFILSIPTNRHCAFNFSLSITALSNFCFFVGLYLLFVFQINPTETHISYTTYKSPSGNDVRVIYTRNTFLNLHVGVCCLSGNPKFRHFALVSSTRNRTLFYALLQI